MSLSCSRKIVLLLLIHNPKNARPPARSQDDAAPLVSMGLVQCPGGCLDKLDSTQRLPGEDQTSVWSTILCCFPSGLNTHSFIWLLVLFFFLWFHSKARISVQGCEGDAFFSLAPSFVKSHPEQVPNEVRQNTSVFMCLDVWLTLAISETVLAQGVTALKTTGNKHWMCVYMYIYM